MQYTNGSRPDVTRMVVIHPQTLLRQGMVQLLEGTEHFHVVGHCGNAEEGVRLAGRTAPQLVLVDGDMDADPAEVVAALRGASPEARVLVFADSADPSTVERVLTAGAAGFTLKDMGFDDLADALRRLAGGVTADVYLHPSAALAVIRSMGDGSRGRLSGEMPLTDRQLEIVRLLADGLQNKQIARRLDIGVHTVKTHISRILDKLDAHSRTEAAVIAARKGLISLR